MGRKTPRPVARPEAVGACNTRGHPGPPHDPPEVRMDNALASTANPNPVSATVTVPMAVVVPTLASRWRELPGRTQATAVAGLLLLAVVLVAMAFGARDSDYRVLFSGLAEKDGGAVIDKLAQMNVSYRVSEGGTTVLVPAAQAAELRLKLAAAGLPAGGPGATPDYAGNDKGSFGLTANQERMRFKHSIEAQLTHYLQQLEPVKSARVLLALPQQNGFYREQEKASVSVNLTLRTGRTLDRAQIAGIVGMVTGSVPELAPKSIRLSDSSGAQLWPAGDDEQGLDNQQLQYRREVEAGFQKRVADLLEPLVGRENIKATVTADIDFAQVMQTAEAYRPNQGEGAKASIREQRSEESNQAGATQAAGVPGAASNLPPTAATAPINGASAPLQAALGGNTPGNGRREAATRYEVDKTTTVTRNAVGSVRRLNAAVVVNHRSSIDAKGKPSTTPLSPQELEQLTALVQQGIGFNAGRGDVVKVVNMPFRLDTPATPEDLPLWKQPWLADLLKSAAAPGALALLGLVAVFSLLRPALRSVLAAPQPAAPALGSTVDTVVDDDLATRPDSQRRLLEQTQLARLDNARAMARNNPAAVAHIVRGWVSGEAS